MTGANAPRALYAEFTARPGMGDQVAALLADFAREVRREPGNIVFDCYRLEADADKFFVHEVYRDEAAFQAHIGADHGAVFNRALGPLIVEPNSVLTFIVPVGS